MQLRCYGQKQLEISAMTGQFGVPADFSPDPAILFTDCEPVNTLKWLWPSRFLLQLFFLTPHVLGFLLPSASLEHSYGTEDTYQ